MLTTFSITSYSRFEKYGACPSRSSNKNTDGQGNHQGQQQQACVGDRESSGADGDSFCQACLCYTWYSQRCIYCGGPVEGNNNKIQNNNRTVLSLSYYPAHSSTSTCTNTNKVRYSRH
mmetsp:Transcript_21629/g.24145  ORF Transcript_21629/g.24145 Transcript_21629/m.24145 type:complete len:118 (-) Transcript_21629:56-409(-)